MKASEKTNRLQYRIDIILTALFLVTIFVFGIMTVATGWDGIYNAGRALGRLVTFMDDPEDYNGWDLFCARIRSVDSHLASNVFASEELGYLNSSFQYAIGKRLINTGATQMLTLESGHLFDLQNYVSMDTGVSNIQAMADTVPAGTPFLFVYEHPTVYEDNKIPEGYNVLDYSEEIAAEITEKMAATDIEMLDSREILPASGVAMEDYLMYTDQHWSTRASLIMARSIAEKVSELTGTELHSEKLAIENFETQTFPELFLGKYGQRIGTGNIAPDDITIYWPREKTNIRRYTNYLGKITDIEGEFKDSVIRWEYLEPDEGKTYNIKAYFDYGLTENYDIYHNEDGADCTILLLKDSYSASIGSFLSLLADEVYAVDLRRSDRTLDEWIQESNPDIVICSYSMQMLRDDAYEFQ